MRAFITPLAVHADARGLLVEPLDGAALGAQRNAHLVWSAPGAVRGNHRHERTSETVVVVGPSLVRLREHGGVRDVSVDGGAAVRIEIPPGVAHAFQNRGQHPLPLLSFKPVAFDPADPDTARDVLIDAATAATAATAAATDPGLRWPAGDAPYYVPVGREVDVFRASHARNLPVMLKGPTGCGKTRFVDYMAWTLGRPLVTVACHDDLSASDLTGRYLIRGGETVWVDGPLTRAVRAGAICYLDEVVEARQDTLVVIHPLTDDRRILPIEKTGELLEAAPGFQLVISYNPGYQHAIKNLKPSTRQRFVSLEFERPAPRLEAEIVAHESGVSPATAAALVELARKLRRLETQGLAEGPGTRLLVSAGRLAAGGVDLAEACHAAIVAPLTDDPDLHAAIADLVAATM